MAIYRITQQLMLSVVIMTKIEHTEPSECTPCFCYQDKNTSVLTANCSGCLLEAAPSNLSICQTALDFSFNRLQHNSSLQTAESLTLFLNDNGLQHMPSNYFITCPTLRDLHLNGNSFSHVDANAFYGLTMLEKLIGLQADKLPDGIFQHLSNLTTLDVTITGDNISTDIFKGLQIKSLHLNVPNVVAIPEGFFAHIDKYLQVLDLLGESIHVLPEDLLVNMTNLQKITFDLPAIEKLPPHILHASHRDEGAKPQKESSQILTEQLKNKLETAQAVHQHESLLSVTLKDIVHIGEHLFQHLPNIEEIQILGAKGIPPKTFHNIKSLKKLTLSRCYLSEVLVDWFKDLSYLQSLNLSSNFLHMLPGNTLQYLWSLVELDVSRNALQNVSSKLFPDNNSMQVLNLRNNHICYFPEVVLAHLKNLVSLDISENCLNDMPRTIMQDMSHLTELLLSGNSLTNMQFFHDSKRIQSDDLKRNDSSVLWNNKTRNLQQNSVANESQFGTGDFVIRVARNPIHCDCETMLAVSDLAQKGWSVQGTCFTPQEFHAQALQDFSKTLVCEYSDFNQITTDTETTNNTPLHNTQIQYNTRLHSTTLLPPVTPSVVVNNNNIHNNQNYTQITDNTDIHDTGAYVDETTTSQMNKLNTTSNPIAQINQTIATFTNATQCNTKELKIEPLAEASEMTTMADLQTNTSFEQIFTEISGNVQISHKSDVVIALPNNTASEHIPSSNKDFFDVRQNVNTSSSSIMEDAAASSGMAQTSKSIIVDGQSGTTQQMTITATVSQHLAEISSESITEIHHIQENVRMKKQEHSLKLSRTPIIEDALATLESELGSSTLEQISTSKTVGAIVVLTTTSVNSVLLFNGPQHFTKIDDDIVAGRDNETEITNTVNNIVSSRVGREATSGDEISTLDHHKNGGVIGFFRNFQRQQWEEDTIHHHGGKLESDGRKLESNWRKLESDGRKLESDVHHQDKATLQDINDFNDNNIVNSDYDSTETVTAEDDNDYEGGGNGEDKTQNHADDITANFLHQKFQSLQQRLKLDNAQKGRQIFLSETGNGDDSKSSDVTRMVVLTSHRQILNQAPGAYTDEIIQRWNQVLEQRDKVKRSKTKNKGEADTESYKEVLRKYWKDDILNKQEVEQKIKEIEESFGPSGRHARKSVEQTAGGEQINEGEDDNDVPNTVAIVMVMIMMSLMLLGVIFYAYKVRSRLIQRNSRLASRRTAFGNI